MKIVESDKFKKELNNILAFIAKDSVSAKNYFSKSLKDAILCIDNMPYKFRKSTLFNDENIRDFIFKKYVIPYYIDLKNDKILLITIYKNNFVK
ncbi:type II toxin-antitoxin system RelE/ParE family toxin [Campylobacter jejuni]|nr:type II toxin-antitoxin system RelE/ParE family toxin [Campylobacter jejuni]